MNKKFFTCTFYGKILPVQSDAFTSFWDTVHYWLKVHYYVGVAITRFNPVHTTISQSIRGNRYQMMHFIDLPLRNSPHSKTPLFHLSYSVSVHVGVLQGLGPPNTQVQDRRLLINFLALEICFESFYRFNVVIDHSSHSDYWHSCLGLKRDEGFST